MVYADQFDAGTHSYWRDGIYVPSCTQVLDFYGITAKGPEAPREHARVRGSVVDEMIQEIERGGDFSDVEIPDGQSRADIMARVNAWLRFRREVPISGLVMQRWRIAEIDGYTYGVTPDIICTLNGKPATIDIKCTHNQEATHAIQTAAQVTGEGGFKDRWNWQRFCLYLKKDGTYRLKPHTDFADYDRWRILLAAHETARELRGEKRWQAESARSAEPGHSKTIAV